MHFLLIYDLAPDYLERRGQFRNDHLKLAKAAEERGEIMLGGALADPADHAFLVFKADSPAPAEAFANADPYVKNGLVKRWQVRPWTTVVGPLAATPVKPT
ncbi:MAG TPA: YciI-like protein [Burkholderiales bacterium]|nr:YciI-like protein [Burkholderiales bacterium]